MEENTQTSIGPAATSAKVGVPIISTSDPNAPKIETVEHMPSPEVGRPSKQKKAYRRIAKELTDIENSVNTILEILDELRGWDKKGKK